MSGTFIMGIDPGVGGGIAIIDKGTRASILLEPMPVNYVGDTDKREIDVPALAKFIGDYAEDILVAYIEKPPIMPTNGAIPLFKLGCAYGICVGILHALGLQVIEVRPGTWMKEIHSHDVKGDTKERSLATFRRMFPNVDARRTDRSKLPDLGLVEAALIAAYGRQQLA